MKDGRLVRRIPMEGPYIKGQHRNELFNFYIEDTEEQFVSFEVEPIRAYDDAYDVYLKSTRFYKAKPRITIERLAEDEVST